MIKVKIVTSMNTRLYYKYGKKMICSFLRHWPEEYTLAIYYDDDDEQLFAKLNNVPRFASSKIPLYSVPCVGMLFEKARFILKKILGLKKNGQEMGKMGRIETYDLNVYAPELMEFVRRHEDRPDQQNSKELYYGAVRFAYKSFSIFHGTTNDDSDLVVWLDADVITHSSIPHGFIENMHPDNCHTSYLGRENNYSECGFVIYNTKHPYHKAFIDTWKQLYLTDEVFKLEQWHDSYLFDTVRKNFEMLYNVKNNNMTPWGKDYDHVFINCHLGDYMDHLKGDRKVKGRSRKKDLVKDKSRIAYWRK